MNRVTKIALMVASLGFFALLFYGKFKLGTAKLTPLILFVGGLVFAASSTTPVAAAKVPAKYQI